MTETENKTKQKIISSISNKDYISIVNANDTFAICKLRGLDPANPAKLSKSFTLQMPKGNEIKFTKITKTLVDVDYGRIIFISGEAKTAAQYSLLYDLLVIIDALEGRGSFEYGDIYELRLQLNSIAVYIIEQKRRRCLTDDGYIRVNNAQYEILKHFWERTGVPVWYLVKTWNGGFRYHFVKLNFWRGEISGTWQARDNYALIPVNEGIECDEAKLVELLADVLEG